MTRTRTFRTAALTAVLSAAALVSVPATALADDSAGAPVASVCDHCQNPNGGFAGADRDDAVGSDIQSADETQEPARFDRRVVIDVSPSVGALLLRSRRPGSEWPDALSAGANTVRVDARDHADYRGLDDSGFVQFVVVGNDTFCDAQGRLACRVDAPNLVRVYKN